LNESKNKSENTPKEFDPIDIKYKSIEITKKAIDAFKCEKWLTESVITAYLETQASQNSTFVIENRAELNSFKKNVIL
jgi:hypothetical protein